MKEDMAVCSQNFMRVYFDVNLNSDRVQLFYLTRNTE